MRVKGRIIRQFMPCLSGYQHDPYSDPEEAGNGLVHIIPSTPYAHSLQELSYSAARDTAVEGVGEAKSPLPV
jgi:hypothetical protein